METTSFSTTVGYVVDQDSKQTKWLWLGAVATMQVRPSDALPKIMFARYYGANLGRFLSTDPIIRLAANRIEPQRWNRYTYALNNPINALDPDGRDVYWVKRQLMVMPGEPKAKRAWTVASHSVIVTTNKVDGKEVVQDTYSWRTAKKGDNSDGRQGDWHKNLPEDRKAAQEALDQGKAHRIGEESDEQYVESAYQELDQEGSETDRQFRPWFTCHDAAILPGDNYTSPWTTTTLPHP